jgi:hypothetical protein
MHGNISELFIILAIILIGLYLSNPIKAKSKNY